MESLHERIRSVTNLESMALAAAENLITGVGKWRGEGSLEASSNLLPFIDEEVCRRNLAHPIEDIWARSTDMHLIEGADHQIIVAISYAFFELLKGKHGILVEAHGKFHTAAYPTILSFLWIPW